MPCAILRAAVHIGPVFQQDVQNVGPAPGAGLMQGRVASVVAVIHVLTVFLEAVENNILWGQGQQCEQKVARFLKPPRLGSGRISEPDLYSRYQQTSLKILCQQSYSPELPFPGPRLWTVFSRSGEAFLMTKNTHLGVGYWGEVLREAHLSTQNPNPEASTP